MDSLNREQSEILTITRAVEILQKDYDELWLEVYPLFVSFYDIIEPENDFFQILYN